MGDNDTVLLKNISHKLDVLLEAQSIMATSMQVKAIDKRLIGVEADVKVIKKVVTDESRVTRRHTSRLNNHETRITDLEDDGVAYA